MNFEKGDVVMITIPSPQLENYGYEMYQFQLGVVITNVRDISRGGGANVVDVLLDYSKGIYEDLKLIKIMYIEHLTLISKGDFK